MQPFKQYGSQVIEDALETDIDHCPADDSTIYIWRRIWKKNQIQLEGALRFLWSKAHNKAYPQELGSLLDIIRNKGSGWLTSVTQTMIITGYGVPTQFAFCP